MHTLRKFSVLILVGLILGAALGAGYRMWSSRGFPVPGYGTLVDVNVNE